MSLLVVLCLFALGFAQTSQGLLSASNGFITVFVKAGDDVDLDCSVPGVAMATVSLWHAKIGGGMRRLSPSSQKLLQNGSIFTVLHIPLSSFGQYECRVADGGPVERTIKKFNVYHIQAQRPVVEIRPRQKFIAIGESAVFTCFSTHPNKIQWNKLELVGSSYQIRRMPIAKRHIVDSFPSSSDGVYQSTLIFKNATQEDSAVYECAVAGRKQYARLVVQSVTPPTISKVEPAKKWSVSVGDSVALECVVRGYPRPSVVWIKGHAHLDLDNGPKYSKHGPYGLLISDVKYPNDAGTYMCLAANTAGHASATINLDVRVAPILDRNHPSYERAGLAKKDIRCSAEYSNPPPTFSWMYSLTLPASWQWVNGTMLHSHGVRITKNGLLTSVLRVPKGIPLPPVIYFLCKASNEEGLDEAIFELHTISY